MLVNISLKTCLMGVVLGTMLPDWTLYVLPVTLLTCLNFLPRLKNRFEFFDVFNTICAPQIGAIIGLIIDPNLFLVACIFSVSWYIDVFLYMWWHDCHFNRIMHSAPYNYSLSDD